MAPPGCSHYDGETLQLRPLGNSGKFRCQTCGSTWRPSHGKYWIHSDEVEAMIAAAKAAASPQ